MSEFGYHYNIHMCEDEVHALGVMQDMNDKGWESFNVIYNRKGIMMVCMKKPMTSEECQQSRMQYAIDAERREKREADARAKRRR